jgi:hypothetical protein
VAISIDWGQRIIHVPKADLVLIQSTPVEILQLNINTFRMWLKDLEDSDEGMAFPDTHRHNTEVTIGGVTLARVVEIINGYTITFEDGQYAVNLVGANSNVADVVNVNQVSVRSANSAGLTSAPAIEYSSFEGGVWIDVLATVEGTAYPAGTRLRPVNNLDDAFIIAESRGLKRIYVIGNLTIPSGCDVSDYELIGESVLDTTITFEATCITENTKIEEARIVGVLNGCVKTLNCRLGTLSGVCGDFVNAALELVTITLGGGEQTTIRGGQDLIAGTPTIDMGGSGQGLVIGGWFGGLKIANKHGADEASINISAGRIILDSTVTAGLIYVQGVGQLINNSVGASVDNSGLISTESVSVAVWGTDEAATLLTQLAFLVAVEGGKWAIVGDEMIFYTEDNLTEIMRFTITRDAQNNPIMRTRQP